MGESNLIVKSRPARMNVHAEGPRVVVLVDGRCVMNIDYQLAEVLGRSLVRQAKKAEETAKASQIVKDQAFLTRTGAPFAFTNRPDILKEAAKEAAHDRDLRRMFPGGIRTNVQFGVPAVIKRNPRKRIGNVGGIQPSAAFGRIGGK